MKFLLDTNVISELRRKDSNPAVRSWAAAQSHDALFLSVITLLEIEKGILLKGRNDPEQSRRLSTWLHSQVIPSFQGRILTVDVDAALRAASLHVPDPAPDRDALIAATALTRKLALVTRNTKDFEAVQGLRIINPWTSDPDHTPSTTTKL